MLVATTDEEHLLSSEAQVAGIDIRGDVHTCQVTDVHGAVRIRQGGGDEGTLEVLLHLYSFYLSTMRRGRTDKSPTPRRA